MVYGAYETVQAHIRQSYGIATNIAYVRQSRTDSGLGLQAKVDMNFLGLPSWLGRETVGVEDAGEAVVQPLEAGVRLGGDHRATLH